MLPIPPDESDRLKAISDYKLDYIFREADFDDLASIAADMAGAPLAFISIINAQMQCFAGAFGTALRQNDRSLAFCGYTILSEESLIVRDAREDMRFCDNPLVRGEPHIRFYAGTPIHAGGQRVGSLCVVGFEPRDFDEAQIRRLKGLARLADRMIETRLDALLRSESEARLDAIVESMPIAIAIYDANDRFVRANSLYFDTFLPGVAEPPKPGATFADMLDLIAALGVGMSIDGDAQNWKARRLALRAQNVDYYEMRLSNGVWLACREVRGPDGSLLATFSDISPLKEREDALALHTNLLRSTLESIDEGVAVFDENGYLIACSEAYFDLLNIPPTLRHIGTHIREIVRSLAERGYLGSGSATALEAVVMKSLAGRNSRRNEIATPDGRVLVINRAVADDGRIIVTCRDITERKAVERLKDEFVATVSHELRTPLTSITGSLGLLAAGTAGELPPRAQRLVGIARDNVSRLTRLVNDLLDIDKIETGQFSFARETITLNGLLARAIAENQPYAQRYGVTLEAHPDDAPDGEALVLEGDEGRLLQVAANLISNAVKYSPRDGTVTIRVVRVGDTAGLTVRDDGPGIPENFRSRIFRRFAQADTSDERTIAGSGLGLAISRAIVEQHGGAIGFETSPGEGSTFHFLLPLARRNGSSPKTEANDGATT